MIVSHSCRSRLLTLSFLAASLPALSLSSLGQDMMIRPRQRSQKGVYQPPTLLDTSKRLSVANSPVDAESPTVESKSNRVSQIPSPPLPAEQSSPAEKTRRKGRLVPTVVQVANFSPTQDVVEEIPAEVGSVLEPQPVPMISEGHGEVIYQNALPPGHGQPTYSTGHHPAYSIESACDAMPMDYGCDSGGDWLLGPRIFGQCCNVPDCGGCGGCSEGFIPVPDFHNGCWYATAEWLNWKRRGQDFPVLAANTSAQGNPALFGGQGRSGEDMDNGFMVSLGRWTDSHKTQAVQARFWALEEQNFGFAANAASPISIGIPFTRLPGNTADFFPTVNTANNNPNEFLNIGYDSSVLGADIVIRQLWNRGLGGRADFVYGYQYFRLEEGLDVSYATQLAPGPPVALLRSNDSFNVTNDFHAAKLGFSLRYDERYWAFDGLFTLGFGGVRREANLIGASTIQNGDNDPVAQLGGSLIQPSNAGKDSDSSFAVSPEVNVGLGYRLNPNMHFRVGYTYLMVTDMLQVYRTIDTSVNLNQPADRPARAFTSGDYWVQGLNLGLTFNY